MGAAHLADPPVRIHENLVENEEEQYRIIREEGDEIPWD
jgi:hypothetical protein